MVIFDTNRLLELAKDFHCLTGATISVWDSNFNQLCCYPNKICPLCKFIKSDPHGKELCYYSDKVSCVKSQNMDKPYSFRCHAGLLDTTLPLWYEDTVVAYIMFGQVRDKEEVYVTLDSLKDLSEKFGVTAEEAEDYFNIIPVLSHEQIEAAANFLKRSTLYLLMSQAIKIEKNEEALKIDEYVSQNLRKQLTVKEICDNLFLPKNTLYQVSNKYFKMPIKKYIALKRIEEAKRLLTASSLPVNEICELVGISDYNYFIRFFKNNVGYSPLKYRKLFSHTGS